MISPLVIKALKIEHAPKNIISISFHDTDYVFRTISESEYNEVLKLASTEHEVQDLICQVSILIPEDTEFSEHGLAGLSQYASGVILRESMIGNIDGITNVLDQERNKSRTFSSQAFCMIKICFPEITKKMFDEMCWKERSEYIALSEEIINMKQLIDNMKGVEGAVFRLKPLIPDADDAEPTDDELKKQKQEELEDLYIKGIDPCSYYNIPLVAKGNIVEVPFIGGRHWKDDDVLNAIRDKIKSLR